MGGVLALLIRTQLLTPDESFLTKNSYNEVVTIHGTTMIFLVIIPLLAGFGNFLVPLQIGARDMAFPRLNALSYWLFLLGGIVLYLSFFAKGGAAPNGWTSYVPLSTNHSPGNGQDLWILALHILSIGSLAGAVNFIVTVHNMRAPGMSWMRIPLFVWTMVTYGWMLVIVLPVLSAGLTMMLLDRQAGTHFFDPAHGGSPLLYQHVFWFFGHPEVYIMILPAMGIISEVLPVFARKPIFGYKAVAISTVGIAFYSLLVWAHHMFAVGLPVEPRHLLHAQLDGDRDPDGREDLQLARDDLARQHLVRHADALGARLHRRVHDRRPLRHLPGRVPDRLAGDGHLLRGRPPPLRPVRRLDLRHLQRPLLLVAEDVRPAPRRAPREVALLARLLRLQPDLHAAALPRPAGHAAPRLHVPAGRALGGVQHGVLDRLVRDGASECSSSSGT